jgi:hypothetical protein
VSGRTDTTAMRRSWLIQRLKQPYPQDSVLGADNPFAFGGGYRNGGLSDEAMGLLRGIFSFDYMGAAEFEWGAVPKAMQSLAKQAKKLTAYPLDVDDHRLYVLCQQAHADEVSERITGWATERYNDLKEQTRLSSALNPERDWDREVCGWLELDNGFFFFTDEAMWRATARLFGVAPGGES